MTTARHIVTLLKSHIDGDEDRFLATAMQLAAHEARQGHGKLAQDLKELVDAAKVKGSTMPREARPVPLVQPKGELASQRHAACHGLVEWIKPGDHQFTGPARVC